jgi:hypothetical protein
MPGRLTIRNTALVELALLTLALSLGYWRYGLGGSEVQAQEDCREVLSIGPETENQITEPFDIEGNSFRVSGDLRNIDPEDSIQSLTIRPIDQDTDLAADVILTQDVGPFEETVLEGPGTFALEIEVGVGGNVEYTVRVEDCGATPRGGPGEPKGGSTNPNTSPAPKTPASPPKISSPAPKTPPPAPKTPAPKESGSLMKAGGPSEGSVPSMPGGGWPQEFPAMRDRVC